MVCNKNRYLVLFANEAVRSTNLMSNSSGYYREICSEEQANILGLFLRQPWGFHTGAFQILRRRTWDWTSMRAIPAF